VILVKRKKIGIRVRGRVPDYARKTGNRGGPKQYKKGRGERRGKNQEKKRGPIERKQTVKGKATYALRFFLISSKRRGGPPFLGWRGWNSTRIGFKEGRSRHRTPTKHDQRWEHMSFKITKGKKNSRSGLSRPTNKAHRGRDFTPLGLRLNPNRISKKGKDPTFEGEEVFHTCLSKNLERWGKKRGPESWGGQSSRREGKKENQRKESLRTPEVATESFNSLQSGSSEKTKPVRKTTL